jgi:hypothetical protein
MKNTATWRRRAASNSCSVGAIAVPVPLTTSAVVPDAVKPDAARPA